jgi:aspartate/methionine/tyrosine aminotransferase
MRLSMTYDQGTDMAHHAILTERTGVDVYFAHPVVVAIDGTIDGKGYSLDIAAPRAAVPGRTRTVVVNTPSNPAGRVFSRFELEGLGAVAEEFGLFLLTDEIHERFV